MTENNSQVWITIYTRPRWEKVVAAQLRLANIKSYVPVRHEVRQWSDRKKVVEIPLLPSYVLVRLTSGEYRRVYQANGVVRIVMFRGRVAVVQQAEIELLKRVEQSHQPIVVQSNLFRANDEVRILSGAFEGCRGKVTRHNGSCRVALQIEQLSFAFVVEVPYSCVSRVADGFGQVA